MNHTTAFKFKAQTYALYLLLVISLLLVASTHASAAPAVKPDLSIIKSCLGQVRSATRNGFAQSALNNANARQNAIDKAACLKPAAEPLPINGGYPSHLSDAPYKSTVDPWGYYNRTSPSYAAFKVYEKNGYIPYRLGNANQWPESVKAHNIPVGTTPQVGSVAINTAGVYGHVAWVEKVNNDGTINVSQYDVYDLGGSGWGHYSTQTITTAAFRYYIYF